MNWGSANYMPRLYLICDFQPCRMWGRKGTLSPCFKEVAVRGTGCCWHLKEEGTPLRVMRRALAFGSEIRLLQKRLGCGRISTGRVAANLSEKAASALHHLQEEQGELAWVRLFWLHPEHRRRGISGRSESTSGCEPWHLSPCFL